MMKSMALPMVSKLSCLAIENASYNYEFCRLRIGKLFAPRCNFTTKTEELKSDTSDSACKNQNLEEADKKLQTEIEKLNLEIKDLKKENEVLNDKYKRALADNENIRIRFTKQVEDAKVFGIQQFCKDLIEVADILGKATESVPKNEISDSNPHLKSLFEGLSMTEAQLHKVFKKNGLVTINPLDEKFNPNHHEALFQQEVEGKKPGTVVVVSKIGYKLHERIIRPALVGVSKG